MALNALKNEVPSSLDDLAQRALNGDAAAGTALASILGLDPLNFGYFLALYRSSRAGAVQPIRLSEGKEKKPIAGLAYSTAVAPPELLAQLPMISYPEIPETAAASARSAILWLKKMHAGTGTSVERTAYLARELKIAPEKVRLGAKGTDLYLDLDGKRVSLAELQLLQSIETARRGEFASVVFQNVVGPDTQSSLQALWRKPYPLSPGHTYETQIRELGCTLWQDVLQQTIPTLDDKRGLTTNRRAPGGHALFALEALLSAVYADRRPAGRLVAALSNGEDLSSVPDARIVGWMVSQRIPIVMVTTQKTTVDKKGGQIALVEEQGETFVTIVESAQAKAAGQEKLFERLGLDIRRADQSASFNTNMALFNYEVLAPLLGEWVKEIGEKAFIALCTPDRIENPKKQRDSDGVERTYLQLEGALGSSLLRLDRAYRERRGKPLVSFIDIPSAQRTQFFSPIKTAFDFVLQFFSDRFELRGYHLYNRRPAEPISVTFREASPYYQDLLYAQAAFEGASLLGVDKLELEGKWILGDCILEGRVSLHNATSEPVRLGDWLRSQGKRFPQRIGRPVLSNARIERRADGAWIHSSF